MEVTVRHRRLTILPLKSASQQRRKVLVAEARLKNTVDQPTTDSVNSTRMGTFEGEERTVCVTVPVFYWPSANAPLLRLPRHLPTVRCKPAPVPERAAAVELRVITERII